jgi:hypothetical protein
MNGLSFVRPAGRDMELREEHDGPEEFRGTECELTDFFQLSQINP